jgi:hypothetical protein
MSYMRGKYYIWTSGLSKKDRRVHIWVGSTDRLMQQSGWAEQFKVDQIMGASLPEKVFDELVVMRYAQLQGQGVVESIANRAMRKYSGNVGCQALCKQYGRKTALDALEKRLTGKRKA